MTGTLAFPGFPLHAGGDAADLASHAWEAWTLPIGPVIIALVAVALYSAGWWRLRSRGRHREASIPKAIMFAAGIALVLLALVSPLDPVGEEYLLSVHMAQHLLLGDLAPLLLVAGISGPLALFVVPRPLLRAIGHSRGARRVLRVVGHPATALVVWTVVTAGWHLPGMFEAALENRAVHDLEHATFVLAGTLIWIHILGAVPGRRMSEVKRAALAGAVFVLGMFVSQTMFILDPLYDRYAEQAYRMFDLTAKADQTIAAMLMTTEQMITLGAVAGLLLWIALDRAAEAREREAREAAAAASEAAGDGAPPPHPVRGPDPAIRG